MGRLVPTGSSGLPWATLAVNLVGCFLLGLLLARLGGQGGRWLLFLGPGLLGGFTTFSSFGHELVVLLRDGRVGVAVGYALSSLILGVLAALAGALLGRS